MRSETGAIRGPRVATLYGRGFVYIRQMGADRDGRRYFHENADFVDRGRDAVLTRTSFCRDDEISRTARHSSRERGPRGLQRAGITRTPFWPEIHLVTSRGLFCTEDGIRGPFRDCS